MIPKRELDKAIDLAKKYGVERLYLVGSALSKEDDDINDYDFAIAGIPDENYFKFYGELFTTLSKNVDLIDISGKKTKFKEIILSEGKLIYEKQAA